MKNGFVHDRALLDPLEKRFRALGAEVRRERPIRFDGGRGYGDLWVRYHARSYLIEAETGTRRLFKGIVKARALKVDGLSLVMATGKIARRAQRRLKEMLGCPGANDLEVQVHTIGTALRWVDSLGSVREELRTSYHVKNPTTQNQTVATAPLPAHPRRLAGRQHTSNP
jgi:hypothetical protein